MSVVVYLFYRVYAVLKLIEKPIFSHLNDTLLADVSVLAELQVICLNVYVLDYFTFYIKPNQGCFS